MEFEELIHSKYSEPAAILKYSDGMLTVSDINEAFISELWMNVSKEEFIGPNLGKMFDEADLKFFTSAVKKCVDTGEDQTVETWRNLFTDCCGFDKVCVKSRLILVEKTADHAVVYEGIRNITHATAV